MSNSVFTCRLLSLRVLPSYLQASSVITRFCIYSPQVIQYGFASIEVFTRCDPYKGILFSKGPLCSRLSSSSTMTEPSQEDLFFTEARVIIDEAEFIIDSFPNADRFAVERSHRKLEAVFLVLSDMADSPNEHDPDAMAGLLAHIASLIASCSDFIDSLENPGPETRHSGPRTGKVGRPRHNFDLDEAVRLHNLGNSWTEVAKVFGVGHTTLWEHLTAAKIKFSRPDWTAISDKELDNMITLLSESHPFAGQRVMQGHLAAAGVKVSRDRVQASLRRVDAIGVILWWVAFYFG
jgi:hypothetical protein